MRAVPSSFIQQIFIEYFLYISASVLGFQDIKMNKIKKKMLDWLELTFQFSVKVWWVCEIRESLSISLLDEVLMKMLI